MFVLIVDDFGIECCDRRHANHLLTALEETYNVTTDWTGSKFAGINIKWDYTKRPCRTTMGGYIAATLLKYSHKGPNQSATFATATFAGRRPKTTLGGHWQ